MKEAHDKPVFACVWDLDGVLVDSGPAHRAAWQALGHELGYEYSEQDHLNTFGLRNPDILRIAWGITGPDEDVARWGDRKEWLFREQARELLPLPGAAELVRALHAEGWKQAIGSSAPHANIDLLLDVLGIADCFDTIVSGEDIRHGKPDPEIFATGMQRVGVPPARSVVVEDAVAGVQGGKASGAFTIGVTTTRTRAELLAAGADLVLDTLVDLGPQRLATLIASRG
jgi:beta-phosphoglucomutase